jgi:hypothetical protein
MAKTQALKGDDLIPARTRPESAGLQRGVYPSHELIPMQFKMEPEFVKAFKMQAVSHGMKMNELLKACFDAFIKSQ